MWERLKQFWHRTPPPEATQQKIERLMQESMTEDALALKEVDIKVSNLILNAHGDYDSAFIVAVLEALARHENPGRLDRVVHTVYRLAISGSASYDAATIQAQARLCVSQWEARLEQTQQHQILVRPFDTENNASDTLLRPTQERHTQPAGELLRADLSDVARSPQNEE